MSRSVYRHRVYGLELETDYRFTAGLPNGVGPVDVVLSAASGNRPDWLRPIWESEFTNAQGESVVRWFVDGRRDILSFRDAADFFIDGCTVEYRWASPETRGKMEAIFLSSVLALLLERRNVLSLHASAVSKGDRVVAFMAASGIGKSTLAAAFLMNDWSLVTDDVLAIDLRGSEGAARPGYPELRLGPAFGRIACGSGFDQLEPVGDGSGKRRVVVGDGGFGRFQTADSALRRIYLLSRMTRDGEIGASPTAIRGSAAVKELLRFSFTPRLAQATGLAAERLGRLADLSQRVEVTRLDLPSDLGSLDEVVDQVEDDLESK